jgi:hypothetical protein
MVCFNIGMISRPLSLLKDVPLPPPYKFPNSRILSVAVIGNFLYVSQIPIRGTLSITPVLHSWELQIHHILCDHCIILACIFHALKDDEGQ